MPRKHARPLSPEASGPSRPAPEPPSTPHRSPNRPRHYEQYQTPQKAALIYTIDYLQDHRIPHHLPDVMKYFDIRERSGYNILRQGQPRRHHNIPHTEERRGRPPLLESKDIIEMDRILQEAGFEGRSLSWGGLAYEANCNHVSEKTIRRAMGTMDYRKCVACRKGWTAKAPAKRRVEFATATLERLPKPEMWHSHRFSDECHAGHGPQQRVYIIRKPGERYCPACIQHEREPEDKDRKRLHFWGAVGRDFKSDLTFYETSSPNGKMTQLVYRDRILKPVVLPWLRTGQNFVLEEDGDSGHGPAKNNNIVRRWKEEVGLKFYFNCPSSPDLSPIENCWRAPKSNLSSVAHWDDDTAARLLIDGWKNHLEQESINKSIDTMPQRLKDVIELEGQITGW